MNEHRPPQTNNARRRHRPAAATRRQLLALFAVTPLAATVLPVSAQDYPNRVVRMIDPYAPGGSTTVVSRALSQKFGEQTGQSMIVDHRPGAGSNIGSEMVAKSPPDGYTVLMGTSSLAINPHLYRRMPFDPLKDLLPVVTLIRTPNVLAVHPSLPVRTVSELIAYAKQHPGKLNYGSSGNGATNHMGMELLKRMAGIDMVHIPFKGGADAMAALLGGQVQVMLNPASTLAPQHRAERLRMLAVASDHRMPDLDLPTIDSSGLPGFQSNVWFGLFVPAGTDRPVIDRLNAELNRALQAPDVLGILGKAGMEAVGGTPEALGDLLATDSRRWAAVVKDAGLRID